MVDPLRELLRSLSAGDLRRILAIKAVEPEIERLRQTRDGLLVAAEQIQRRIDQLVVSRTRGESGRRISYGKRVGPTVREMCEEILAEGDRPMSAAEAKNRILERWPGRNTPTLYNQVFIAMGRSDLIKKARKGEFALREGARKVIAARKETEKETPLAGSDRRRQLA